MSLILILKSFFFNFFIKKNYTINIKYITSTYLESYFSELIGNFLSPDL